MKNELTLGTITFTVYFPDNFPPDEFSYYKHIYYGQSHQWRGQVDKAVTGNLAWDAVCARVKWKQSCEFGRGYYWLELEFDGKPSELSSFVEAEQGKLQAEVDKWMEMLEDKQWLVSYLREYQEMYNKPHVYDGYCGASTIHFELLDAIDILQEDREFEASQAATQSA